MQKKPKLSIITASYNSQNYIDEFIKKIKIEILKITKNFEIIIVDDNSTDNSVSKIQDQIKKDKKIKLIQLNKNFGQHKSIITGIEYSNGDYIYTTDIDLEVDATYLGIFHKKLLEEKSDHIYGIYLNDSSKKISQYIFKHIYFFLFKIFLSNTDILKKSSTMIFNKKFRDNLFKFKEKTFTISGISSLVGNSTGLEIRRNTSRSTSYSFAKRLDSGFDLLTNYSKRPIYLVIILSFFASISTFIIGSYMLFSKFIYNNVLDGYTSIIVTIAFLGSLIMLSFGFVLIFLLNILIETKKRPRTIIKKIIDNENK